VADPDIEWNGQGYARSQIAEWTKNRGKSPRLYPGALVWCIRKPGRDLREKVELWLAWKRVAREIAEGTLGGEYDRSDRADIQSKVTGAEDAIKDEVWGGYRFAVLSDNGESDGLKVIDLGAGHSSSGQTLCGRVISALKSEALLNESVGAGYIDRNWPPALKESGAWPMSSLRQSLLNGTLTRLIDPDTVLKIKVTEFVQKGEFGLASGQKNDGSYERIWFEEMVSADEVTFEKDVFLLNKTTAKNLKLGSIPEPTTTTGPTLVPEPTPEPGPEPTPGPTPEPSSGQRIIRLSGSVPPEVWNRLGTKLLPKLRSGTELEVGVSFSVSVSEEVAENLIQELRQILDSMNLSGSVEIE
jgi:hypothetical protein